MPAKKPVRKRRAPGVCPEKQYSVPGTRYSESGSELSPCRKGDLAEIAFLGRATALGFIVSKPFGHAAPYDFLIERGGRTRRIQVKSAWSRAQSGYCVNTRHCALPYGRGDFDFLVAYVAPCDAWYVIPSRHAGGASTIRFYPGIPRGPGGFERYREAWHLLTAA